MSDFQNRLQALTGHSVSTMRALHGGMIGDVYRVELANGETLVAKIAENKSSRLNIEGAMLRYLREHSALPVPEVLHSEADLLLMTFIPGSSRFGADAQRHAAELIAALHSIHAEQFGLDFDTLIGGLHQPNPLSASWLDFFREQRLMMMGRVAHQAQRLPIALLKRLGAFCEALDRFIEEPDAPSLIHGDLWTANILARDGQISGFVDPAIYYAHPEIELAFSTLFGTFDEPFFERYQELRPIAPGFFEERRDIYNLYPLLVHARLFGSSYISAVDRTLRQFGY